MKIERASVSTIALAGDTAVHVVVAGTGLLDVGGARRFVFRRVDGVVRTRARGELVVRARGLFARDERVLRSVVVAPAPAPVDVPRARVAVGGAAAAPRVDVVVPRVDVPVPPAFPVTAPGDTP